MSQTACRIALLISLIPVFGGCASEPQAAAETKAQLVSWGNPREGLQHGISMTDAELLQTEPVMITVHVKNVGQQERTIRWPYHHVSEFVVTNAKGEVMEPRIDCCKKHVPPDQYTPRVRFVLKPGETRSYTSDLLHLGGCSLAYPLPPGTYKARHQLSGNIEFRIAKKKENVQQKDAGDS